MKTDKELQEEAKELMIDILKNKQKLTDYFGDDKPRPPLDFIKAFIELKIPIPLEMFEAIEDMHGVSIWEKLGGHPLIREEK